jgi:hypothetical protein
MRTEVGDRPCNNTIETEGAFSSRSGRPGRTPFGSLTKSSLLLNDVNPPVIHETSIQQTYHGQDSLHLVQGKLTEILSGTGRQNLKGASKRPLSKFWLPGPVDVRTFTPRITIPYNPLIMAVMRRAISMAASTKKHLVNVFQKAKHYSDLLQRGVVNSKAELARKEGIPRARITQILNLLNLTVEIQEYLATVKGEAFFTERRLRRIALIKDREK